MRIIGRFVDQRQVSFAVDTLRNGGFDRKDMIITDLADVQEQRRNDPEEVGDEMSFLKTEREGLWETGALADGIEGFKPGKRGIIIAVETPKHETDRVRAMLEQSGAVEILQD